MDLLPPRREEIQDQSRDRQRSEGEGVEQESTRDYLLSSRSSSRSGILCPPLNRIRTRQELHWIVARVVGSKEPARRKMRFFTAGRGPNGFEASPSDRRGCRSLPLATILEQERSSSLLRCLERPSIPDLSTVETWSLEILRPRSTPRGSSLLRRYLLSWESILSR